MLSLAKRKRERERKAQQLLGVEEVTIHNLELDNSCTPYILPQLAGGGSGGGCCSGKLQTFSSFVFYYAAAPNPAMWFLILRAGWLFSIDDWKQTNKR